MNSFQHHTVKIRKTKANKKALPEWNLKRPYPVLAMEVESVTIDRNAIVPPKHKDGNNNLGPITHDIDEDDDEDFDGEFANPNPEMITIRRVWLLLGSPDCGEYAWITTDDVKYVNGGLSNENNTQGAIHVRI